MKRFLLKVGFKSDEERQKAEKSLLSSGISQDDIDHISLGDHHKNIEFDNINKAPFISFKLGVFGLFVGAFTYFYSLFKTSELDFIGTILSFELKSFIFTALITQFIFSVVGYIVGRKYRFQAISFHRASLSKKRCLMSILISKERLERVKSIVQRFDVSSLEVNDLKEEVEFGLRNQ